MSSGDIFTCRLNLPFPEFLTSDHIIFATFVEMPERGLRRQVTGENIRSNPVPSYFESTAISCGTLSFFFLKRVIIG